MTESGLKINNWEDLYTATSVIKGINPQAQQTINDFMDFTNIIERTNLPTRLDVQRMVFFDFVSRTYFPDEPENPFGVLAEALASSFMAKGGEKAKQFVEMMKQTPSLADLQTLAPAQNNSFIDRFLGRSKEE